MEILGSAWLLLPVSAPVLLELLLLADVLSLSRPSDSLGILAEDLWDIYIVASSGLSRARRIIRTSCKKSSNMVEYNCIDYFTHGSFRHIL